MSLNSELNIDEYNQRMNSKGHWVYIVPVTGVNLTDEVQNEFRIKRVLLVKREKLHRIRQRLGITKRLSEHRPLWQDFFEGEETFAVVQHTEEPENARKICRRLVQDELSLLAVSQLGFTKRRLGPHPTIKGLESGNHIVNLMIETGESSTQHRVLFQGKITGKLEDLYLNALWKNFQREMVFDRLLKILNGKIKVDSSWRSDLERAAILIGQSHCSTEIAHSFLWNMIALELLLTEQRNKQDNALSERAEALLGWVGSWEIEGYESRIRDAYKKRCGFVHDGNSDDISISDLLFTDDLLFNLLLNLVHHTKLFQSKKAVIDFSNKLAAERTLGLKPRVRPKTFKFFARGYTDKDYEEL